MSRRAQLQRDFDLEVADRTGEDVATIRRLGFSPIDLTDDRFDDEPNWLPPSRVDWDELDRSRHEPVVCQPLPRRVA